MASSSDSRSLLSLAVVERQLILACLDIASLARCARTCKQLQIEAMHPQAGRWISEGPGAAAKTLTIRPRALHLPAHECPLIRAHCPVNLRLDQLASLSPADCAQRTEQLLAVVSSLRRVVELSLWGSPASWSEEDALRLIRLVPGVRLIWGIRTGTIWLQSAAVRDALFDLPLRSCNGLTTSMLGGELPESSLARSQQLRTIMITIAPSNALALNALKALPALTSVELLFTTDAAATDLSLLRLPLLPHVTQLSLSLDDDQPGTEPAQAQLAAILGGLPGLVNLTLEHFASPLQTIIDLGGAKAFPALRSARFGAEASETLLKAFREACPACSVGYDM